MTRVVLILAGAATGGMLAGFAGLELHAAQLAVAGGSYSAAILMTGVALVLVCLSAYVLGDVLGSDL